MNLLDIQSPDPTRLPGTGVWQETIEDGRTLTLVAASFPDPQDFICDAWLYEGSPAFMDARRLPGGGLELRHDVSDTADRTLVTTVTLEPGAVEFTARIISSDHEIQEDDLITPNICWQLRRAPGFSSKPDLYPEFVRRCFLFTEQGMTFLGDAERLRLPARDADHPSNNPPWVQTYLPAWDDRLQPGAEGWAASSPTRYTHPVIGVVSRDRRHLAAIACARPETLCQAWHDCMHAFPPWLPENAPPEKRTWRMKVYVMKNDGDALLRRVARDFPEHERSGC